MTVSTKLEKSHKIAQTWKKLCLDVQEEQENTNTYPEDSLQNLAFACLFRGMHMRQKEDDMKSWGK